MTKVDEVHTHATAEIHLLTLVAFSIRILLLLYLLLSRLFVSLIAQQQTRRVQPPLRPARAQPPQPMQTSEEAAQARAEWQQRRE